MSCQPMAGNLDLLQREEAMSNPAGNMVNEQVQRDIKRVHSRCSAACTCKA